MKYFLILSMAIISIACKKNDFDNRNGELHINNIRNLLGKSIEDANSLGFNISISENSTDKKTGKLIFHSKSSPIHLMTYTFYEEKGIIVKVILKSKEAVDFKMRKESFLYFDREIDIEPYIFLGAQGSGFFEFNTRSDLFSYMNQNSDKGAEIHYRSGRIIISNFLIGGNDLKEYEIDMVLTTK